VSTVETEDASRSFCQKPISACIRKNQSAAAVVRQRAVWRAGAPPGPARPRLCAGPEASSARRYHRPYCLTSYGANCAATVLLSPITTMVI
jgi:hypothetical protein